MLHTISKYDILVDAMTCMTMKTREKESISLAQNHNSLRGRWFGSSCELTAINKNDKVQIERGSVIKMNGSEYYLVYTIYKDNGSKWFPASCDDKPSWPLKTAELKHF